MCVETTSISSCLLVSSPSESSDHDVEPAGHGLVQATNRVFQDDDDDIEVIDIEDAENIIKEQETRLEEPTRSLSDRGSSSIVSASPLPSSAASAESSPRVPTERPKFIPPEAKDEVVIISNNETTVIDEENEDDEEEEKRPASPDTSHVSVVVVGDESVQVSNAIMVVTMDVDFLLHNTFKIVKVLW